MIVAFWITEILRSSRITNRRDELANSVLRSPRRRVCVKTEGKKFVDLAAAIFPACRVFRPPRGGRNRRQSLRQLSDSVQPAARRLHFRLFRIRATLVSSQSRVSGR